MKCRTWMMASAVVLAATMASVAHADVFNMGGTRNATTGTWTGSASLEFVPVGNPGNAADPATGSQYASVPYTYQMGKYDVTVGQYTAFLNAVAKTDTYGFRWAPGRAKPAWKARSGDHFLIYPWVLSDAPKRDPFSERRLRKPRPPAANTCRHTPGRCVECGFEANENGCQTENIRLGARHREAALW